MSRMAMIPFRKMHGLGNDFVVLDARLAPLAAGAELARAVSDRHRGVGCDQFIVLEPSQQGDVFMRIRNSDGSEAEACGNATRCIAGLLMTEQGRDSIVVETLGGLLACERAENDMISVDMGPACLAWHEIPLAREIDTLQVPLSAVAGLPDAVAVNMANPHAVIMVDDADQVDLATLGPLLEHDPMFPQRANISFIHKIGPDHLRQRVWERSAGLTLACGSGACAAAVAAFRRGLTGRRVRITMDGGDLFLEWRESDGHVLMTGPVATSFTGVLNEDLVAGSKAGATNGAMAGGEEA